MTGRPTLTLKLRAKPAPSLWKCKPCGGLVTPPAEGPDDEAVRCPKCGANLGKAGDFRATPPVASRIRARPAPADPAAPVVVPEIKKRPKAPV